MTFTRDNIVGVEFTVKGRANPVFKVEEVHSNDKTKITWFEDGNMCSNENYATWDIISELNNGTWIVKNSKV